jgi:hypothetical protein
MIEYRSALRLLGRFIAQRGAYAELIILGGASLHARALTARATRDVDVFGIRLPDGSIRSAHPLDDVVRSAALDVAEVLGLSKEPLWLDDQPARDFTFGAPPGFETRLEREEFDQLVVWHLARIDILAIKLLVAAEQLGDPDQKHLEDVRELGPTADDLRHAIDFARHAWSEANASWPNLWRLLEELRDA